MKTCLYCNSTYINELSLCERHEQEKLTTTKPIADEKSFDLANIPFSVWTGVLGAIGIMVFTKLSFPQASFIGLLAGILYWKFVENRKV